MSHTLAPTAVPSPATDAARFLRLVLRVDSASTAVMGLVLVAAAAPLGSLTGMPVAFAMAFGIFQLGGAACLALIAGYPVIPAALARTVVAVNAVCAAGCLVTAVADVMPLNGTGVVLLLIGAVIVAVYTGLQYTGLRRMTAATG
ncbi:hypothetical protein [Streptomyces sp. V2I9]|uniref:hypothetical protein n=1 Tax=Streptomyces sp. V2I9 TaxID=3042304 RepID=UPI0027D80F6A|nr:hypothetical protein [Streptomyces sp. V2I9]